MKLACRSDATRAEVLSPIEVLGRSSIAGKLDGAVDQRREIIKAVRAGEPAELSVKARTFRQKAGSPNSRFLRHLDEHLPELAASYKGQPLILDHRAWDQRSRMGTIAASEVAIVNGWSAFDQTLHVVKPEAVIGVLDGTLDRFSIGWSIGAGDVICTLHGTSPLKVGYCGCWPGDLVEGLAAEWEFSAAIGKETSAVNDPAVDGTSIQSIREVQMSLAAELGLDVGPSALPGLTGEQRDAVLSAAEQLGIDPRELATHYAELHQEHDEHRPDRDVLADVAEQLGLDVEDLEAYYQ